MKVRVMFNGMAVRTENFDVTGRIVALVSILVVKHEDLGVRVITAAFAAFYLTASLFECAQAGMTRALVIPIQKPPALQAATGPRNLFNAGWRSYNRRPTHGARHFYRAKLRFVVTRSRTVFSTLGPAANVSEGFPACFAFRRDHRPSCKRATLSRTEFETVFPIGPDRNDLAAVFTGNINHRRYPQLCR